MNDENQPARSSKLEWVPADDVGVNPVAQREFRPTWAQHLLDVFNPDKMQTPHVNRRADGGLFYMDGQHTGWAYRGFFGPGQMIQVWLYDGLTEAEEADMFLALNDRKSVDSLPKFRAAVTAGREREVDINNVVEARGLRVSYQGDHSIAAVAALGTIYDRYGSHVLDRALSVIQRSFANNGYERPVLLGVAMVQARYGGDVSDDVLVVRLSGIENGWKGLVQKANLIRAQMGVSQQIGAAAAVVEFYNAGRGGKKLPHWFREQGAA